MVFGQQHQKLKFLHHTLNNCIIVRYARVTGATLAIHYVCPEGWQGKSFEAQEAHQWGEKR